MDRDGERSRSGGLGQVALPEQGLLGLAAHEQAPKQAGTLLQPGRDFAGHTMFLGCWKMGEFSSQVGI